MMTELVTITVEDGVADVRLNRADKYNALSPEMFAAITEAGEKVASLPGVRVVVLSGEGRGFCAGLDFSSFKGMGDRERKPGAEATVGAATSAELPENHAQRPGMVWKRCPVPVICALHGVAFGGGLQVALGADIRIASPDAKLSVMEIKWGLVPDMGLTQTVRDLIRLDVLKELTFTGRVLSGKEAAELGLVTRVADDPRAEALALAREIAGKSPDAIRAGKKLLEESWHAEPAHGLALEASLQGGLIGSPNQLEAVKSVFEERPAQYTDVA